jgi:hypothetical protein
LLTWLNLPCNYIFLHFKFQTTIFQKFCIAFLKLIARGKYFGMTAVWWSDFVFWPTSSFLSWLFSSVFYKILKDSFLLEKWMLECLWSRKPFFRVFMKQFHHEIKPYLRQKITWGRNSFILNITKIYLTISIFH